MALEIQQQTTELFRSPKSKLCEAWREAIKAKNVQNLNCNCERAHSIEELVPPSTHRRNEPGAFIDVWDLGDSGIVKTYPSQQVYVTKGSEGYFSEVYTRRRPPPRVLHCYNYLKYGKCDNWDACKYIHVYNPRFEGPFPGPHTISAAVRPTQLPSVVVGDWQCGCGTKNLNKRLTCQMCGNFQDSKQIPAVNTLQTGVVRNIVDKRRQDLPKAVLCPTAKDGQQSPCACPLAHSYAELIEPPTHVRCIPGFTITVETADKLDKADYPSDQVYATLGANKYLANIQTENIPAIHCTTFVQYGKCSFWENCHYIHVSSTRASASQLLEAQYAYTLRQQQTDHVAMFNNTQGNPMLTSAVQQPAGKINLQGVQGLQFPNGAKTAQQFAMLAASGRGYMGSIRSNVEKPDNRLNNQQIMTNLLPRGTGNTQIIAGTRQTPPEYTPKTIPPTMQGTPTYGETRSKLCPNWKAKKSENCLCNMAHGYDELEPPLDHVLLAQGHFMKVSDPVYGTTTYPSQQIYQTQGALNALSGQNVESTHCRDFLKFGKCEEWTNCPYIHVWRAS